jgi:hypothetical protein
MGDLSLILHHLKQPEYLHVVLNHWPVEGLAAGAFALAWGLLAKSMEGRRGALCWLVLMGVMSWVAIHFGEKGYDRVYAMSNGDAQAWLDLHVARAERFEGLFTLTTFSALAALAASWKRPVWEKRVVLAHPGFLHRLVRRVRVDRSGRRSNPTLRVSGRPTIRGHAPSPKRKKMKPSIAESMRRSP